MNQDHFTGLCRQVAGRCTSAWGRLTGNPRAVDAGRHELLAGRMQARYGASQDAAARQLRAFRHRLHIQDRGLACGVSQQRPSKLYLIRS